MKKILLFAGIVVVILGCYLTSIYSFRLHEQQIGSIELSKNGGDGIMLSKEETSDLINELNELNFKLFNKDLEVTTNDKGYEFAQEKFRIFVRNKKGTELVDIRIYDAHNIACVRFLGPIRLTIGFHATQRSLDLETLSALN